MNLLRCPDDVLLTFLCEMIHPVVRSDNLEVQELLTIFNKHLAADGFHIAERTRISGKPVFAGGVSLHVPIPETKTARKLADALASEHVLAQITRMESSIYADPTLAIGTAKEFVESICKGILDEYNLALSGEEDIPKLVFLVIAHAPDRGEGLSVTVAEHPHR